MGMSNEVFIKLSSSYFRDYRRRFVQEHYPEVLLTTPEECMARTSNFPNEQIVL